MKSNRINARVFDQNVKIFVSNKKHFSLDEATKYVKKYISDTADIKSVEHLKAGKVINTIRNRSFKKPFQLDTTRALSLMSSHRKSLL